MSNVWLLKQLWDLSGKVAAFLREAASDAAEESRLWGASFSPKGVKQKIHRFLISKLKLKTFQKKRIIGKIRCHIECTPNGILLFETFV